MCIAAMAAMLIATPVFADDMEKDDLPGPKAEVATGEARVQGPAIPPFELPAMDAGFRGPRELRVRGRPLMGTEVRVKGYVTWIYDCPAALAMVNPEATRAQVMMSIDEDPTLCESAKFYLGDTKETSRDSSIWVVDVPRAPTKSERQKLPKAELKAWPTVPKISVGDYVTVTGTWGSVSTHEQNTEGLLIYKAFGTAAPPAATAARTTQMRAVKDPEIPVVTTVPPRKVVLPDIRNASVDHVNACNKAIVAKRYDAAIAECTKATKIWEGNHLAWYAWASAHMAKTEWSAAKVAAERAVALRPDLAMYQLYYGISLYEAERERVRSEQATRERKKPESVVINPALMKLTAARDALLRATKLGPDLWRAHYYLGRVYRDQDDPRRAANQFTQTIATHSSYKFGYIALIELYRRWDYTDQALATALIGTANVPESEAAELWFEAGMAYEAKRSEGEAIDAFTRAIAVNPNDVSAKFQRGQLYFRRGEFASARIDLEEVTRSSDPKAASAKPIASQLLAQMTSQKP